MALELGLQTYSMRRFTYERALEVAASLKLNRVEGFPGHIPADQKNIAEAVRLSEKHGIKLLAHGVHAMHNDRRQLVPLFDFAKAVGIRILTADPDPDSFDLLDEMVQDYGIAVAIHNHGPGHRYARVDDVLKAIEGHHDLIGMCLDTGHLTRAGDDVVEAVGRLGSRMYEVHLKDVNEENKDVVIGTGRLDFRRLLSALKDVRMLKKCPIILEYEPEPDDPVPGITKSIENFRSILGDFKP